MGGRSQRSVDEGGAEGAGFGRQTAESALTLVLREADKVAA